MPETNLKESSKEDQVDSTFKSAFLAFGLFGGVQLVSIASKIAISKCIAVFFGPNGVGLAAYWASVLNSIRTVSIFGVDQTSVREIAQHYESRSVSTEFEGTIMKAISFFNVSGIFGSLLALIFSLGYLKLRVDIDEIRALFIVVCFPLSVYFTIRQFGEVAILRGILCRREIALGSVYGLTFGAVISLVTLLWFNENAVLISLAVVPICLFFSLNAFRKTKFNKKEVRKNFRVKFNDTCVILRSGSPLAVSSLISVLVQLIIIFYLEEAAGIDIVGLYSAGLMITIGYFSVLLNALTTDYFPRLSSVIDYEERAFSVINNQALLTLFLIAPLLYLFVSLKSEIIVVLYSASFSPAADYLFFAVWGVAIMTFSNQLDLYLIAKRKMKQFIVITIIVRSVELIAHIILFKNLGLLGLGLAVLGTGLLHFTLMFGAANYYFNFRYNSQIAYYLVCYVSVFIGVKFSALHFDWIYKAVNVVDIMGLLVISCMSICLIGVKYYKSKVGLSHGS
jgi:O-antigen/teichoic acid export membrane protein